MWVFGAAGAGDDFKLAYFYAWARLPRIVDGPDAVHRRSVARQEIKRVSPADERLAAGYPDNESVPLAPATAQGRGPGTAAATAQLHGKGQDDPRAAHPDRMAEGDGAPVDVDAVQRDVEVTHGSEGHRGERLVDLDEVQVGHAQGPVAAQRVADRVGRRASARIQHAIRW